MLKAPETTLPEFANSIIPVPSVMRNSSIYRAQSLPQIDDPFLPLMQIAR
jgi:hypothetical protein